MSAAVESFDVVDLITTKRHGNPLTSEALDWLIDAYMRGVVAPEQMSAWLMAVVIRGMEPKEISDLTEAMIRSGERLDFSVLASPAIDKHSTGGVGDNITLPLVPLVASHGIAVPQLSGRGLGHTGGTLDKLESIPGWRANLTRDEMFCILEDVGGVICAAGPGLVPADQRMYALRDVTGTVAAIPLVASSIMSKKIAEGAQGLVLDVKFGSGAFLSDYDAAKELAQTMVRLGRDAGLRTVALLTDMDAPLGRAVGNANEVREALDVLAGGGPDDVVALTLELAREMLVLGGRTDVDPAEALRNGRAMDVWRRMIRAQGGNPDAPLPKAKERETVRAQRDGIVQRIDARSVGVAAWRLGAGRPRPGAPVNHAVGVEVLVRPGERVRAGDVLFHLDGDEPARVARALEVIRDAAPIGDSAVTPRPLVAERIEERVTEKP